MKLNLFLKSHSDESGPENVTKAKKLVDTVLRNLKLKYSLNKKATQSGVTFRHSFKIDGIDYVIKSVLTFQSDYLSCVLWSGDEQNLIQVVTIGPLKDYYLLRAVGEKRLKAWMENEHGSKPNRR